MACSGEEVTVAGSPLRSLQHIDSSANNNSNTKNGNCATVTVPPRAGQTTGADGHGQQHQADRIFASPTSVTASTRVGKEAEKKSTQLCHCSNRDNDRVSVLHQRVEELQAQCEAESAARISAEARAKRAESSLTEAQERISSLEVALRECAGLRFRAFSEHSLVENCEERERCPSLPDHMFNSVPDATEIRLVKASNQVQQRMATLPLTLPGSKMKQNARDDGDGHDLKQQRREQHKTRWPRGSHHAPSLSSMVCTSGASSPHSDHSDGSSSAYCTSPTATGSTSSSVRSSCSESSSSSEDETDPPPANAGSITAGGSGAIVSASVRTPHANNSDAARSSSSTATVDAMDSPRFLQNSRSISDGGTDCGGPDRIAKRHQSSTAESGRLVVVECGSMIGATESTPLAKKTLDTATKYMVPAAKLSGGNSDAPVVSSATRVTRLGKGGGIAGKEFDTRRAQGPMTSPGKGRKGHGRHHGPECADGSRCVEVPVGREDEGLLLGGGRVLHKLKEEMGGTLEYRRGEGIVLVYGQQNEGGPAKAAACVRTALLLSDGGGGPKAEEYAMARLSMDDLFAECIALKGLRQTSTGARGKLNNSWTPPSSSPTGAEPCPLVVPTAAGLTSQATAKLAAATTVAAAAVPIPIEGSSSTSGPAVAPVGVAGPAVASAIPEGEYPPEPGSLRIIGETFGCVIDVAGEVAAAAAMAAAAAAAKQGGGGSANKPVGSATPVQPQDILIWGPAGSVVEAKEAVAALVSGNACAEVVVGAARIKRRDRGFWVNCETMASSVTIEVDHKRGSVWVRGSPEAVEEGRKDFQNKLASLFPGDFLAVPMPRAALKDLANSKGLACAAAEARAEHKKKILDAAHNAASKDGSNSCDGATAPPDTGDEEGGVELWADWPCSCVRLRGEPASVRCVAKALIASLAEWKSLEVSVRVDRAIVTRLLSRSGRILAGISSNMGITLLVEREKGVLRGRARTEQDAKDANRVLQLKVDALSLRRPELHPPQVLAAAPSIAGPRPSPPIAAGPVTISRTLPDSSEAPSLGSNDSGSASNKASSERGGQVVEKEQQHQTNEKELTDPFDELQAFFAGESLPNTGLSSADGKRKSCVFDGVEDVPSSSSMPATCADDSVSSRGCSNISSSGIKISTAATNSVMVEGRAEDGSLRLGGITCSAPSRHVAPSLTAGARATVSPPLNTRVAHTNHNAADTGSTAGRSTSLSGMMLQAVPPPVVHPSVVSAYHQYGNQHPRRSAPHLTHRLESFSSGGNSSGGSNSNGGSCVFVDSSPISPDVVTRGTVGNAGPYHRGSSPHREAFDLCHHSASAGSGHPGSGHVLSQKTCAPSPSPPQHPPTIRHPAFHTGRQPATWSVPESNDRMDQYSSSLGEGRVDSCSVGRGGDNHSEYQHYARSRGATSYEAASSSVGRADCPDYGRRQQHRHQLHLQHQRPHVFYSESDGRWRDGEALDTEGVVAAENRVFHRHGAVLARPASTSSTEHLNDSYITGAGFHHNDSYDIGDQRGYPTGGFCDGDDGRAAFQTRAVSIYGDGGRSAEHDYEYETSRVRQVGSQFPAGERCSFPAVSRGVGRVSVRGW